MMTADNSQEVRDNPSPNTQPRDIGQSHGCGRRYDIEAWRQRRAEIIKRYGSADAAYAPCQREQRLLDAVEPWRTTSDGWTLALDGWRDSGSRYREMPARARQAIKDAIPMPATFAEAMAEDGYWQTRSAELRDLLSEDGKLGDDIALDLIAETRQAIVLDAALYELPVTTLSDLRDRIAMYRETGLADPRFEEALFRDVAAMAAVEQAQPSIARTDTQAGISDRIRSALSANSSQSDRCIARMLSCSPTSVGRVRNAMGLRSSTRAVSRGGKDFEMRISRAS